MILAYISIALMGIFVKLASDSLPSSEILFARFLIGTLFLLPFLAKTRDFRVDLKQWHFLVLRNLAGEFVYDTSAEPSIFYGNLGKSIGDSFKQFGKR